MLVPCLAVLLAGCGKKPLTPDDSGNTDPQEQTDPQDKNEPVTVSATQVKAYLEAQKDLEDRPKEAAGVIVLLYDSKYYAVDERVLSVSYEAAEGDLTGTLDDGKVTGGGKTVTMTWSNPDPYHYPVIGHGSLSGSSFGLTVLPGTFRGKFTVKTSRYTYTFTKGFTAEAGKNANVALDFAEPDEQPTRKVGVLGDSISTMDGAMVNEDYSPFYPGSDPNVTADPSIAVDAKEKTYWWKTIYNYMKHGELDVNSSWSGTRVVHEIKSGRVSKKSIGAGFVDRAYDFVDPDIILLHGGTNDKNQSSPLGTYDWDLPIGQLDENCYRSAYIKLIKMLQNRYEGVQIIIIIGDTLTPAYESSTLEIAKHFGLPYVNFVGVNVPKCKGSHPTEPGMEQMAKAIYAKCADYLP